MLCISFPMWTMGYDISSKKWGLAMAIGSKKECKLYKDKDGVCLVTATTPVLRIVFGT